MMLPARMTRILLGGHVSRMEDAIEALHKAGVLHLEDYDGGGHTSIGTPLEAGDEASSLLVRVRGLQKSIGAEDMPARALASDDEAGILEEAEDSSRQALATVQQVRTELALTQAEVQLLEPFAALGFELSLVNGLDSVRGYFGTARAAPRLDVTHEMETVPHGKAVALVLFVRTTDTAAAEAALQDVGFAPSTLPTGRAGHPAQRLTELYSRRAETEARLKVAEAEVEVLRAHWGPKLAALAGTLAERVDKTQAPLRFGVTERTFHAEGWVPKRQVDRLRKALSGQLGTSLYLEVLGDAPPQATARGRGEQHDEGEHVTAVGHDHHHPGPADEPPVSLQNPRSARPYEYLLSLLGRPRYGEIDPSRLMLLFFPLFFGLMVGDVLIGALIVAVGFFLIRNKVFGIGGPAIGKSLIAGGVLSIIVGAFIFGEALGMHFVLDEHALEEGEISWEAILYGRDAVMHGDAGVDAHGLIHKTGGQTSGDAAALEAGGPGAPAGITLHAEEAEVHEPAMFSAASFAPHSDVHLAVGPVPLGIYSKTHDAQALLQWAAAIGFVHVVLGLFLGIRNVAANHGAVLAIQEKASWLILIAGAGVAIYGSMAGSTLLLAGGVGAFLGSIVLLWIGVAKTIGQGNMAMGFIALLEIPALVSNILSYTRLAAIGASKAGMAIAFAAIAFDTIGGGDLHSVLGWIVYLLASMLILVLAIIAGTLQSLRLQFVEFFGKFYEGGGRPYVPFGRRAN